MMSFIVLSGIYFVFICLVIAALVKEKICQGKSELSATVIVCIDHDKENLPGLIEALIRLDYPETLLEILLVTESSDREIVSEIQKSTAKNKRIRPVLIYDREEGLTGRKNAITQAVGVANGEIILLTESNCRPGSQWVRRMINCFDEETGMVMGFPSIEKGSGLMHRFLEFDQLAKVAVQTAGAYWNIPPYSSARNLAFRRRLFFEVNGYESSGSITTGDDFFLTRDIWLKTKRPFRHAIHPESFVETKIKNKPRKFLVQQLKKSGQIYHLAPFYKGVGLFILMYYGAVPIAMFTLPPLIWAGSLLIKTILEWTGIMLAGKRFGFKYLAFWYPLLAPVYPLYVFTSAALINKRKKPV